MAKVRASYRAGVAWIGFNDEPIEREPDVVAGLVTVLLLADLFDKEPETVAADVIRWRHKHWKD